MRGNDEANMGLRIGGLLALIGAVGGIALLFVRGWLTVRATFAADGVSGVGALRRLGIDVDKPVAAVAERVIGGAIPPTMWQAENHTFRIVAALLALAALLLLGARFVRRGRRGLCWIALGGSGAAALLMVVVALQIRAQVAALPEQITAALGTSGVLTQVVGYAIGVPQVTASPGWPLIIMAAAVGVTLLAAVATAATLPRRAAREDLYGDTDDPAAV